MHIKEAIEKFDPYIEYGSMNLIRENITNIDSLDWFDPDSRWLSRLYVWNLVESIENFDVKNLNTLQVWNKIRSINNFNLW